MDRTPVRSSNVVSVGYDKNSKTLEVEFRTGRVYQYAGVHANTARAFLVAPSKGKYVWRRVRDKYSYVRV